MGPSLEQLVEAARRKTEEHFRGPDEPRIPTMERKVVVEAAIPGWHPKAWYEARGVNNLPPITFDDQANAIVECVRAGAAVIHTHPRDPETGLVAPSRPTSALPRHAECLEAVMDRAFEKIDFVTCPHTFATDLSKSRSADYITETKRLLEDGRAKGIGNKYVQTAMITTIPCYREDEPVQSVKSIQEGTKWFEDNDVKPMFSVESFAIPWVKEHLFDNGVAKAKPYWIAIQEGKHIGSRIFSDPWGSLEVITSMGLAREAFGTDAFIGIHPAGRNWLSAAATALLCGAEFVRVGIEDQFYLYPHRDDISHKASDTTEMIVRLIKALGREVASPQDVRQRVGIKPG